MSPEIDFLSFNDSTFTVAENTTANLAFTVTTGFTDRSRDPSLHNLESVSIGRLTSSKLVPHCQIAHTNGTCQATLLGDCVCNPVTGKYEMTLWVDRQLQHSQWAVTLHFGPGEEPFERRFVMNVVCKRSFLYVCCGYIFLMST